MFTDNIPLPCPLGNGYLEMCTRVKLVSTRNFILLIISRMACQSVMDVLQKSKIYGTV